MVTIDDNTNLFMTPNEYIESRLRAQQKYHSKKSSKMQKAFKMNSIIILILSAIIPVLTIFVDCFPLLIKSLVAITSGAISVLSGIITLCKYQETYVEYRIISEKLKRLEFCYKTKTPPYDKEDAYKQLVIDCEDILNNANTNWYKIVSNHSSTNS